MRKREGDAREMTCREANQAVQAHDLERPAGKQRRVKEGSKKGQKKGQRRVKEINDSSLIIPFLSRNCVS